MKITGPCDMCDIALAEMSINFIGLDETEWICEPCYRKVLDRQIAGECYQDLRKVPYETWRERNEQRILDDWEEDLNSFQRLLSRLRRFLGSSPHRRLA